MTDYLAFTQAGAAWLLAHTREFEAFVSTIPDMLQGSALSKAVLSAGPLRLAASTDGTVLAFWDAEYLNATGTDGWGYIRLNGRHGALTVDERFLPLMRTALRVFEARLQALLLPDSIIPRSHGNESFTCVIGSGHDKDATIAYLENLSAGRRSVVVVGPEVANGGALIQSHRMLLQTLDEIVRPNLPSLTASAPRIVEQARGRPSVDDPRLGSVRHALLGSSAVPVAIIVVQPQLRGTFPPTALTYDAWVAPDSGLSDDKRRILESDILEHQPLRVSGPAGAGKTLLLQLMAIRICRKLETTRQPVLYIAHNTESRQRAEDSLVGLWPDALHRIKVATLHQICVERLNLPKEVVLDADASETRRYQMTMIADALRKELSNCDLKLPLLGQSKTKGDLFEAVVFLIAHEISSVIKPLQLYNDPRRYAESERPYSRFHGLLTPSERRVVLGVFNEYHSEVFERGGLLDSDDLALSLLSRLRTPVWALQRRAEGFDYVFVDEAQLYNENERRLFPILTKNRDHIPVAFALDEAQGFGSNLVSGFAALGIASLRDEALRGVFRTTESILRLAFNIIQQTTDLFGPDFPDFTTLSASVVRDEKESPRPSLHRATVRETLPDAVVRHVRQLRRNLNMRHIGVIILSDRYYDDIVRALRASELQVIEIAQRSQRFDPDRPIVAACTPRLAGGQEFDAVIVAGIERGVVPPSVPVEGLALALEQQVLRELYLSFTRAKYVVRVVNSSNSTPSNVLESAIKANLLLLDV